MSKELSDLLIVLAFTIIPVMFQLLLSFMKKRVFGFIIPVIWLVLGIWILVRVGFDVTFLVYVIIVEIILIGIHFLIFKRRRHKENY